MATASAGFTTVYGLCVGTQPGTGPGFPQGSIISRIKVFSPTSGITPGATGANTAAEQTFTVTGLAADDKIFGWQLGTPNTTNQVMISNVRVSAANTLAITFVNNTAGGLTHPAITTLSIYVVNTDTI